MAKKKASRKASAKAKAPKYAGAERRATPRVVTPEFERQPLKVFAERRPDLVVLDGNLPDIDGLEVCRRLRRLPGGEKVPILMCTVRSAMVTVSEGIDAGVTDYVLKPFEMEDLLERISDALKKVQN